MTDFSCICIRPPVLLFSDRLTLVTDCHQCCINGAAHGAGAWMWVNWLHKEARIVCATVVNQEASCLVLTLQPAWVSQLWLFITVHVFFMLVWLCFSLHSDNNTIHDYSILFTRAVIQLFSYTPLFTYLHNITVYLISFVVLVFNVWLLLSSCKLIHWEQLKPESSDLYMYPYLANTSDFDSL